MDGQTLQDRIYKGMGVAGRRAGAPIIVYRPMACASPLNSRNRIIKLCAAFSAADGRSSRGEAYGEPIWQGVFDASYTAAGDYLVGDAGTFFVISQAPLLPVMCVKTNRVLTIQRPIPAATGGYSGMVTEAAVTVLQGWPASVMATNARISGTLPERRFGSWSVLLPSLPQGASLIAGDIVEDDSGRSFVTAAAEQSDLGWRLIAREVAG